MYVLTNSVRSRIPFILFYSMKYKITYLHGSISGNKPVDRVSALIHVPLHTLSIHMYVTYASKVYIYVCVVCIVFAVEMHTILEKVKEIPGYHTTLQWLLTQTKKYNGCIKLVIPQNIHTPCVAVYVH